MCTAIKVDFKDGFFGRNMDIDHSFGEQIIITPRNYRLKFKVSNSFERHYAIMGVGTVIDEYPLYADAMNEKGLCFAGLSFKDNAKYYPIDLKKDNYTPYELPLYILGTCDDIKMAKERLKLINLIDIPFKSEIPLTSLHFMFSDKNESIVLESTVEGIKIYDNPYHVLTNNPPFIYHLYNLNNYQGLHNGFIDNKFKYDFDNYSYGLGALSLPGDFSSVSRLVRAFYLKENLQLPKDEEVITFFKILNNVSMIKGTIKTEEGFEYTRYSSCYDLEKKILYYQIYDSMIINEIKLDNLDLNTKLLVTYQMLKNNYFHCQN